MVERHRTAMQTNHNLWQLRILLWAVDEGWEALDLVRESIPRRFGSIQLRREVVKLKRLLRIRTSAELVPFPEMSNSAKGEAVLLFNYVFRFAWQSENESILTGACI